MVYLNLVLCDFDRDFDEILIGVLMKILIKILIGRFDRVFNRKFMLNMRNSFGGIEKIVLGKNGV